MLAKSEKYTFEDYLTEANDAKSVDALFKTFLKAIAAHGLDRAVFSLATDHDTIGQKADFAILHNYPADWLGYYAEKKFARIDPVIIYGASTLEAFSWSDIPSRMKLSKLQRDCLNMGQEAGLNNGVCTPLRGPNNQLAGIALATSEKKDAFDGKIDLISAYCNHFYLAYRRLHKKTDQPENIFFTEKEQEIMNWTVKGLNKAEIGEKVHLSAHTVDTYLRKIYRKLGVNNRQMACVKAIMLGLAHM